MQSNLKNKLKILMVEDDELNIRMVSSFIRDKYDLDSATSGDEALKKSLDNQYDIFLMDIGLKKELTGLDVTNKLRKMSKYKETPIIALTAYALSGDKQRIIRAGCSHYLSKPFTKHQLLQMLENVIHLKD
jgi:CheY-like chemotaxis protein